LTPEAKEMFADFHNGLADDRNSLVAGIMKSILSKMSGYALRIALVLHIAEIASNSADDNFPDSIPAITADTMGKAITLVEWFKREGQRIIGRVQPNASVTVDREVTAILKHIDNQGGETTARLVSQYVNAFSGRGGSERASLKLESMCRNGLLTANDTRATNGRRIRVYSPATATTYAVNGDADAGNIFGSKV
jgi:competence protein ComGC